MGWNILEWEMTHEENGKRTEGRKGKITRGGKRKIQNDCMGREEEGVKTT